jgi:hypothetical protein
MHLSLLDYEDSEKAARSYLLCLICLRAMYLPSRLLARAFNSWGSHCDEDILGAWYTAKREQWNNLPSWA